MKTLFLALSLLLPTTASAQQRWVEGAVGVITYAAPNAVYVWGDGSVANSNFPKRALAPLQWHSIDLSMLEAWGYAIPTDAKAVFLSAALGTSGKPGVYCGMVAALRKPGSGFSEWNYQIQAVASLPGGAFRQSTSVWVPIQDRKIEFWWNAPDLTCPLFINITIQAYLR